MYHGSEMSPQDNDFDWVTARNDCSVMASFSALRIAARKNVEYRNAQRSDFQEKATISLFEAEDFGENGFCVRRHDDIGGRVCFEHEEERIKIERFSTKGTIVGSALTVTVTLNDEGECRYRIDGEGEFKTWQVLRRSLEHLFFGMNN